LTGTALRNTTTTEEKRREPPLGLVKPEKKQLVGKREGIGKNSFCEAPRREFLRMVWESSLRKAKNQSYYSGRGSLS